jgi:hypothetical protein
MSRAICFAILAGSTGLRRACSGVRRLSAAGFAGPWPSISNMITCFSGACALAMNFIAFSLPPGLPLITAIAPGEIRPWSQTNLIWPPESFSIRPARVDQMSAMEASPLSSTDWLSAPPPQ